VDGVLSADDQSYTLPTASTNILGGIRPDGTTITVNPSTGVASAVGGSFDGWIPSSQYITITYGVSGDMYTAPADGWMYAKCTASNTNAYITAEIILTTETSVGVYGSGAITYSSGRSLFLLFPVAAGYNFKMWNSNLTVNIFRFVYAKGAL
jgi:hypothetical protein